MRARTGLSCLVRTLPLLAVALGGVVGVGCPADPGQRRRDPIATVGDVAIDDRRVLATLAQRGVARVPDKQGRQLVTRQILEQIIDEELVLQAAARDGVVVAEEAVNREVRKRADGYAPGSFQSVLTAEQLTLDSFREGIRRRLTQDAFLRARLSRLPPITDLEIQSRYDGTVAQEKRPAQVRARQVQMRTAEEAKHVLDEIRGRKLTVEQAAQKYSTGLEADAGGDLGWFAQGEMPRIFDICFILQPGQVSDVVASDYGFHIFQVVDKREQRTEPLAAVRDSIAEELLRERQSEEVETIIAGLRQEIPVAIAKDGVDRLVALLPEAPVTPAEVIDQGNARALDSHDDGVDPIPPLPK